jgi:hypothetical protein
MTFIRSLSDSSSEGIIAAFDGLVRKGAQVMVEEQGVAVEKLSTSTRPISATLES